MMKMRPVRLLTYTLFSILAACLIYTALCSWTSSIYLNLDPVVMPIYFAITLFLFLTILNEKLTLRDRFLLVVVHSFLTRIVFFILFYPGISGDNFQTLARERTWDIYGEYYLNLWPEPLPYLQNILTKLFAFQRSLLPHGLVVSLSKMLYLDLFWIHSTLLGLLWSFFVPIIGFKIVKALGGNDRTGLLGGCLTANAPTFIFYSVVSAANTFGFFFSYATIYFLLQVLPSNVKHNRRSVIVLLLIAFASLWAHSQTGIVSLMLIFLAFSVGKAYSWRHSSPHLASFTMFFALAASFLMLPVASVVLKYLYAAAPTRFSLTKFLELSVYQIIFANYTDYTLIQALTYGTLSLLAILGMLTYRASDENKKLGSLFLVFAFLALNIQYRVFFYFIEDPPFGPIRLIAFLPFIAAPFAAISIDFLLKKSQSLLSLPISLSFPFSRSSVVKFKFDPKQVFVTFIIAIGLSGLLVEGCLTAYRNTTRSGPVAIVSVSSLEAAKLIHEEYQETREKYVAVTDGIAEGAGVSVVGFSNPEEFYVQGIRNREYYLDSLSKVSPESLVDAASITEASLVYLLASKWSFDFYLGKLVNFAKTINLLTRLYETFSVVGDGDGQIYIFRFRVPLTPFQGVGPAVTVLRDSQRTLSNTTYSYELITSVVYTLNLAGSSVYNVTGWPAYWSYENIAPSPLNVSIDANAWISFSGSQNRNYEVTWLANEVFKNVTWKEDAFLSGWTSYKHGNGSLSLMSDGDILTVSASGFAGYYVHLDKQTPELRGSLMLQARFIGTSNSLIAFSLYEQTNATLGNPKEVFWSGWKRPSSNYATLDFPLPLDYTFTIMRIWIRTIDGSRITVSLDYIMILYE